MARPGWAHLRRIHLKTNDQRKHVTRICMIWLLIWPQVNRSKHLTRERRGRMASGAPSPIFDTPLLLTVAASHRERHVQALLFPQHCRETRHSCAAQRPKMLCKDRQCGHVSPLLALSHPNTGATESLKAFDSAKARLPGVVCKKIVFDNPFLPGCGGHPQHKESVIQNRWANLPRSALPTLCP